MFRTAFVVLVAMACAQARPQLHLFVPVVPKSSGTSNSAITKGETITPFGGTSTIIQQQSGTGGQVSNGGFNFGTASSDTQSLNTPFGSSTSSNTDAQSVQGSNPAFPSFGGFPAIPVISFGSAAKGSANSGLTQGKTTGPDGSTTTIIQLGSSATGSAQNGGTSVNKASGSTSSTDGIHGSQTQSNLDSQSIQTSRR